MTEHLKKDNHDILSIKKPVYDPKILSIIKDFEKCSFCSNLAKIMLHNEYEKMIPFNLWFRHASYKICNSCENNQHMRIRYYKPPELNEFTMLTPLVTYNNSNLQLIKKIIPTLSLYQPFYPDTFYAAWQFLQLEHLNPNSKDFLNISREERLGFAEALIFYHEKYQHTYQYNVYHSWLVGKEMYNMLDGTYNLMSPKINYLEQAYKIYFLKSSKEMTTYDFINIDCIHIFNDIFTWSEEEMDLQAILFYLLSSLKCLKPGGCMLLRLNMIASQSWSIIFNICDQFFSEYIFFRPSVLNPLNSEIYLFVNKFSPKKCFSDIFYCFLKNLYRQKMYLKFHINITQDNQNPILKLYISEQKKWIDKIRSIYNSTYEKASSDLKLITEWHASNDLKQIQDLTYDFDENPMQFVFKTSAKQVGIKPIVPNGLYSQQFYKKLIEKRAELNYYKRVMDTKPSQIFLRNRYDKKKYAEFLSWEILANKIDMYQNLKYKLKIEYGAEMMTNAWLKMYEILNMFADMIPGSETVNTFHLCEAPGAFIAATNHYLSKSNQKLNWYAQTLKPTNIGLETDAALEDHFGLIAAYPDKWLFGGELDNSGDITHSLVIQSYAKNPLLANIDFMTADAGLQCDPTELNEQEAFLGKINMGQIICILACLTKNKSAVFKTFLPMSEPLTISMIYLVTHLFENVTICKPTTSHSTNSEVYIVLQKYKGISQNVLDMLYAMLDDPKITSKTLLFSQIDMDFFKIYMANVEKLINRQIKSLCRSYYYYYNFDKIPDLQKDIDRCTNDWLRFNTVVSLDKSLLATQNKMSVNKNH